MYLKPKAFTALFEDIRANHQKIQAALYLLAHHVTDVHQWRCQDDRDDAAANAAVTSIRKIENFDARKGNAFVFFTQVIKNDLRQQHRDRTVSANYVKIGYQPPGEAFRENVAVMAEKDNSIRTALAASLGQEIAPHRKPAKSIPDKPRTSLQKAEALLAANPELSVELIKAMAVNASYAQIADLLNQHGYRTHRGKEWDKSNLLNRIRAGTFEARKPGRSANSNIGGPRRINHVDRAVELLAGRPELTLELVKQLGKHVTQQVLVGLINDAGYRTVFGKLWNYSNLRHAITTRKTTDVGPMGKMCKPSEKIESAIINTGMSDKTENVDNDIVARKAEIFDIQIAQDTLKVKWDELERHKGLKLNELKELLQAQAKPE